MRGGKGRTATAHVTHTGLRPHGVGDMAATSGTTNTPSFATSSYKQWLTSLNDTVTSCQHEPSVNTHCTLTHRPHVRRVRGDSTEAPGHSQDSLYSPGTPSPGSLHDTLSAGDPHLCLQHPSHPHPPGTATVLSPSHTCLKGFSPTLKRAWVTKWQPGWLWEGRRAGAQRGGHKVSAHWPLK